REDTRGVDAQKLQKAPGEGRQSADDVAAVYVGGLDEWHLQQLFRPMIERGRVGVGEDTDSIVDRLDVECRGVGAYLVIAPSPFLEVVAHVPCVVGLFRHDRTVVDAESFSRRTEVVQVQDVPQFSEANGMRFMSLVHV